VSQPAGCMSLRALGVVAAVSYWDWRWFIMEMQTGELRSVSCWEARMFLIRQERLDDCAMVMLKIGQPCLPHTLDVYRQQSIIVRGEARHGGCGAGK
jgi:hypothetical protein